MNEIAEDNKRKPKLTVEEQIEHLKSKGVTFEQYDALPHEGDIHICGAMRLAWFKDPDGNVLHLVGATG